MGIVVSTDKLRPYKNLPTTDSEHTSINMELTVPNGMSTVDNSKLAYDRWNKMFNGSQKYRHAPSGNGK